MTLSVQLFSGRDVVAINKFSQTYSRNMPLFQKKSTIEPSSCKESPLALCKESPFTSPKVEGNAAFPLAVMVTVGSFDLLMVSFSPEESSFLLIMWRGVPVSLMLDSPNYKDDRDRVFLTNFMISGHI